MIKITYLKKKELNKIKGLLFNYKFNDYRSYGIKKELLKEYSFKQVSDLLLNDSEVIVANDNSLVLGLATLVNLPWDTKYFGFKMAEAKHLIANGSYHRAIKIKKALMSFILDLCRQKNIKHLTAKIDVEDFLSVHFLESCGFNLMGTHLTYILNLNRFKIPEFKERCRIRTFKKGDLKYLIELTKLYSPESRFSMDPYLPKQKAQELYYVEWVKNSCKGLFADKVLVAERNNKIVGFATYKLNKELKKLTGINCLHQGLLIVSPEGKGSALALLKAIATKGKTLLNANLAELDVYIHNFPIIRMYQRVGMLLIRVKYCFHKWIES